MTLLASDGPQRNLVMRQECETMVIHLLQSEECVMRFVSCSFGRVGREAVHAGNCSTGDHRKYFACSPPHLAVFFFHGSRGASGGNGCKQGMRNSLHKGVAVSATAKTLSEGKGGGLDK